MATLTEALNQGSLIKSNAAAGAPTNLTQAIQGLSAAKAGKDVSFTSSPAISNVQEQVAQQEVRTAAQKVQEAGAFERRAIDQQVAQVQEVEQAELVNLDEQRMSQQSEYQDRLNTILDDFEKQGEQLDFMKQKALAEQAGFLMRMSSDKYISQLETQGRKSRLNSEINFKDALARSIFRDEIDLFQSDLDFRAYLNSKDRAAKDALSVLSLDQALALATASAKSEGAQKFWSGVGDTGSAVAGAYDKGLFESKPSSLAPAPAPVTSQDPTASTRRSVNSSDGFDLDRLDDELNKQELTDSRLEKKWQTINKP